MGAAETQNRLQELAPDLWIYKEPLSYYGIQIGRVMIVIRLKSGELFINSPAQLTKPLRDGLDQLGRVSFVTAANRFHGHMFMEQYKYAYPDVKLFAAPGLPAKRRDLSFDAMLGSTPDPRWSDEIDQEVFMGNRFITEVEFLHLPSRTLVLGDICFNIRRNVTPFTSFAMRMYGAYKKFGMTRDIRLTTRNKKAARRSIETILEWDFDRIIVGHGEIVESGGKEVFRDAFDWLL